MFHIWNKQTNILVGIWWQNFIYFICHDFTLLRHNFILLCHISLLHHCIFLLLRCGIPLPHSGVLLFFNRQWVSHSYSSQMLPPFFFPGDSSFLELWMDTFMVPHLSFWPWEQKIEDDFFSENSTTSITSTTCKQITIQIKYY